MWNNNTIHLREGGAEEEVSIVTELLKENLERKYTSDH